MNQQPIVNKQNVTLSLPFDLLQQARVAASHRNSSLSELVAQLLRDYLPEENDQYQAAMNRQLYLLESPPDLGTYGTTKWTRDELHER